MINSSHELTHAEKRIVDRILTVYGNENGEFLSELTHNEKPWYATRGNLSENANCERVIENELIREAYMI